MADTFLTDRLTANKAAIVAAEEARLAILSGAIETYSLDTGQSVTKVTKLNIGMLERALTSMYNDYATLNARINGSGVSISRPGF